MARIGKLFADAGLRDLCVEAGVIADVSISGVIDGHRYNQTVRLHKLLYDAFLRLAWKGFHPWLEQNHQEDLIHLECMKKYLRQDLREPSSKIYVNSF